MLSARDGEPSRRTPFWFPEPHLRVGFLWREWQSVPSLQKLHSRCCCIRNLHLFYDVKIHFASLSCWSLYFPGVVAQQSEMWFLDRSLCWHFLTATFTSYYRLMITHLGLPEWQYAFTPYGPSPQAKVVKCLIALSKATCCDLKGICKTFSYCSTLYSTLSLFYPIWVFFSLLEFTKPSLVKMYLIVVGFVILLTTLTGV